MVITIRTCSLGAATGYPGALKRRDERNMEEILVNEKWMIPAHSREEYQTKMPKVGDRMLVKADSSGFLDKDRWAEVIAVNPKALYYTVKYNGLGFTETMTLVQAEAYKCYDRKYGANTRKKRKSRK